MKQKAPPLVKARLMNARASDLCRCGNPIKIGDLIYYNRIHGEHLCYACGLDQRPVSKQAGIQSRKVQAMIDRIKQLENLPDQSKQTVQSELASLRDQLRPYAMLDRAVLAFFAGKNQGEIMRAKNPCHCSRCGASLKIGTLIGLQRVERKTLCSYCILTEC